MMFDIVSYRVEETQNEMLWDKGGPDEKLLRGQRHILTIRTPSGDTYTNSREFMPIHVLLCSKKMVMEQLLMEMVRTDLPAALDRMEAIQTHHSLLDQARRGYYV